MQGIPLAGDSDTKVSGGAAPRPDERVEIGGFELLERIGRGGMGSVYRARQISMDRIVALKVLSQRLARNEGYVERFIREARAAAKLNHPNIVQGIDVGSSGGYYYFAMEYVNGETVAERVKRQGPLPEKEALSICVQVARALQHAHSRAGIIHRDVKPQNILLDCEGHVKLADLGLARETLQQDHSATLEGTTLGTPDYISPEQIRGETNLDGRCDIYSLGATLYHLLTGRPPYQGETSNVVMAKHLTEPPPDPRTIVPSISAGTAAIVRKAMQKDRARRYQTIDDMLRALQSALRRLSPAAPAHEMAKPIRSPRQHLSPFVVATAIGAAVVVAAIIAILTTGPGRHEQTTLLPRTPAQSPDVPPPKAHGDSAAPAPTPVSGEQLLVQAQQLASENPDEPWRIEERLRRLLDRARGTEQESALRQLLDDTLKRIPEAASAKLSELRSRADDLCRRKRFGEAEAVFRSFFEGRLPAEWMARFREAASEVIRRADEEYTRTLEAANAAAAARKFDEAIAIMQDVAAWGLPSRTEAAHELIQTWQAEKARDEKRLRAEQTALRIERLQSIIAMLQERRCEEARTIAAEAAKDPALTPYADEFAAFAQDIELLESLWQEVEQRVLKLKPGDPIRLGSILRSFVKFENGFVSAEVGTHVETVPLRAMSDVDLFSGLLAEQYKAEVRDPSPYLRRGLFYTFDKQRKIDVALREFTAAEQLGAAEGAARGRRYIDIVKQLESERVARQLLTEARTAARQEAWKTLAVKLEKLNEFRETQVYKDSMDELAELGDLAAMRGERLAPGLIAIYHDGRDFNRVKLARIDRTPNVDIDRLRRRIDQTENVSVRWEGYMRITEPGRYRFALVADDGFRFWLNGAKLLEKWSISPQNVAATRPLFLERGFHKIRIEFFQGTGGAYLQLRWNHHDVDNDFVPPDVFFHSLDQAEKLGIRPAERGQ